MGTRNLTCVVLDGEYKVAQYCQWDGYPDGQGLTILEFLRDKMDREKFVKQLKNCRFISPEELEDLWGDVGANDSGFVDMETSNKFKQSNPQLSRDMGGDILEFIQNANGEVLLKDSIDFAQDSLYCEWAYVVDFDKNVLEVYSGFNESPVPADNRFQGEITEAFEGSKDSYGPILLQTVYSLDALPTNELFVRDLTDEDEDELMSKDKVREGVQLMREGVQLMRENRSGDASLVDRICNHMDTKIDEFLEFYNVVDK